MRYIDYKVLKNIPLFEESVFKHFLNLQYLPIGVSIKSPFYIDRKPSFIVYNNNGSLYFTDFKLNIHGSCVDLVMYLYKIPFMKAVYLIAKELNLLHLYDTEIIHSLIPIQVEVQPKKVINYKYKKKKYTKYELSYWQQFGLITEELLLANDVYSPKQILSVYDNHKVTTTYDYDYLTSLRINNKDNIPKEFIDKMKKGNLCFVYDYNKNYNFYEENKLKIYKPYCKDKWKTNCNKRTISGLRQLSWDRNKLLIVQKAKKEELCMKSLKPFIRRPFDVISTVSENTWIDDASWNLLLTYYPDILLWLDNDKDGRKASKKISEKFNLKEIDYNKLKFKNITDMYEALQFNSRNNATRETLYAINSIIGGGNIR